MIGTFSFHQFFFRVKALAAETIVSPILSKIDVSRIIDLLEDLLDRFLVIGIRCPNKIIIRDTAGIPGGAKKGADTVSLDLRLRPVFFGRLGDLVPMLIGPREQEGLDSLAPVIPLQGVGNDGGIGVAQVRLCVDVIQRGCKVKITHMTNPPRIRVSGVEGLQPRPE